jgi:hypothetical protein
MPSDFRSTFESEIILPPITDKSPAQIKEASPTKDVVRLPEHDMLTKLAVEAALATVFRVKAIKINKRRSMREIQFVEIVKKPTYHLLLVDDEELLVYR